MNFLVYEFLRYYFSPVILSLIKPISYHNINFISRFNSLEIHLKIFKIGKGAWDKIGWILLIRTQTKSHIRFLKFKILPLYHIHHQLTLFIRIIRILLLYLFVSLKLIHIILHGNPGLPNLILILLYFFNDLLLTVNPSSYKFLFGNHPILRLFHLPIQYSGNSPIKLFVFVEFV